MTSLPSIIASNCQSRVHIRPRLWSNYNRIEYEMNSHQLLTVPDYNWITVTSNNPKGVVWRNYSAWLNKIDGHVVVWGKQSFDRFMEWRGGATWVKHHAQQQTCKDKISQGMADGGYSRSARQCGVKINKLKQKYRKIHDGNKLSGNQRHEWEMFEPVDRVLVCKPTSKPSLFEFLQMWTEP